MNLVKRLWCHPAAGIPHLREKLGLDEKLLNRSVRNATTEDIARRNATGSPYIAVLAMDGDEIGKWVSGANLPHFLDQLAPAARDYLANLTGTGTGGVNAKDLRRLLTPSYHLQFSEALANFAMHRARAVVEEHEGDLIYAGGDDILAILPSTRAIECAQKLRDAFRTDFGIAHVSRQNAAALEGQGVRNANAAEFAAAASRVYPGSRCEVSCGIAVGHKNAPLQMLVREAQSAEKRAKSAYGRAALALALYKRSGEILHWGCKWNSRALALMRQTTALSGDAAGAGDAAENPPLSGKFAHALAALLKPYALEKTPAAGTGTGTITTADLGQIILAEFDHALSRQGAGLSKHDRETFRALAEDYLAELAAGDAPGRLADFSGLFLAENFLTRFKSEN
ncbi:MAG: type III-B CRISPR-associated protein Cas10/Cmr2 [Puniceicoccales bacterium]|jgi:hypothetical protein|nr:type III-B CRISPR-associated protein Cas10/Cmr2 [Puniceicoccales bacterium]